MTTSTRNTARILLGFLLLLLTTAYAAGKALNIEWLQWTIPFMGAVAAALLREPMQRHPFLVHRVMAFVVYLRRLVLFLGVVFYLYLLLHSAAGITGKRSVAEISTLGSLLFGMTLFLFFLVTELPFAANRSGGRWLGWRLLLAFGSVFNHIAVAMLLVKTGPDLFVTGWTSIALLFYPLFLLFFVVAGTPIQQAMLRPPQQA